MFPRRARTGFTKLEVILAGLTILVLIGLVLPSVMSVRNAAIRAQCWNNMRSIGFAVDNYHDAHKHYPQGTISNPLLKPERRLSWMMAIQPFIEANDIYAKTDKEGAWDSSQNQPQTRIPWRVYQCPRTYDSKAITTSYLGVAGVGPDAATLETNDLRAGVFGYDRVVTKRDCTDGTSNTILIAESLSGGPWAQGGPSTVRTVDPAYRPHIGPERVFGSWHPAGIPGSGRDEVYCDTLRLDGSIRGLTRSVSPEVLEALATIRGGETVSDDW
jgi:hypothetical protein